MKLLTISIAAYNVAQYLEQALQSCIVPEIMDKLEVLIVNDGSTDETPLIAHVYEKKYPQTFRLINKENGGYGSTINLSIKEAKGKYFKQLDGDDWFEQDGLKKLMHELENTDADILITPMRKGPDVDAMIDVPICGQKTYVDLPVNEFHATEIYGMWHLAIKMKVLQESNMVLPEHRLYTDQFLATIPFAYAKTIRFTDKPVYCYRIGRDGQSVSRESRIRHSEDALAVFEDLLQFFMTIKHCNCRAYLLDKIRLYYLACLKTLCLDKINRKKYLQIKKLDITIRNLSPEIYALSNIRGTKTFAFISLMRKTNYIA